MWQMMSRFYVSVLLKVEVKVRGGATIGAGRDMSRPLLRDVPRRGDNPIYVVHLRGTTAGR